MFKIISLNCLEPIGPREYFNCIVIKDESFTEGDTVFTGLKVKCVFPGNSENVIPFNPELSVPIRYVCMARSSVLLPTCFVEQKGYQPDMSGVVILHPDQHISYKLVGDKPQLEVTFLVPQKKSYDHREQLVNVLPDSAKVVLVHSDGRPNQAELVPGKSYKFYDYNLTENVFYIQNLGKKRK